MPQITYLVYNPSLDRGTYISYNSVPIRTAQYGTTAICSKPNSTKSCLNFTILTLSSHIRDKTMVDYYRNIIQLMSISPYLYWNFNIWAGVCVLQMPASRGASIQSVYDRQRGFSSLKACTKKGIHQPSYLVSGCWEFIIHICLQFGIRDLVPIGTICYQKHLLSVGRGPRWMPGKVQLVSLSGTESRVFVYVHILFILITWRTHPSKTQNPPGEMYRCTYMALVPPGHT